MDVRVHALFLTLSLGRLLYGSPCNNYKILDSPNDFTRSVANGGGQNCDNTLAGGWVRFISKSGERMPTQCVYGGFRCGTQIPIWMNDTYPEAGEQKNVTACAASYNGDCCKHSYQIPVMNCTKFLLYYLVKVHTCPQAYCFGTEMPCPETHVSPNGFSPGCKYEPCLPINHMPINQWERSIANKVKSDICDNTLTSGWYRSVSLAGETMPTTCPKNGFSCGTASPIWMKGKHPTAINVTQNVTTCASNFNGDCCKKSYNIQVRNCGSFYIYNLQHTDGCFQAYCFGNEIPCPIGQTSPNGFTPGCVFDPCQSVNYHLITGEPKRTSNYTLKQDDVPFDDSEFVATWYRCDSITGNDLVTEPVTMYQCGTIYPMWMNGTIPMSINKTEDRKVCRTGQNGNVCQEEYTIKVRNCGTFRTYKLLQTNVKMSAYCFGTLPVPPDATSNTGTTKFYIYVIIALIVLVILLLAIIVWKRHHIFDRSKVNNKTLAQVAPPPYEKAFHGRKDQRLDTNDTIKIPGMVK